MSIALTAAGPNFFDLQDDEGNTLVYLSGGKCALQKVGWNVGQYTNLYTVPSKASNLVLSAYMYEYTYVSTTAYRGYWGYDPSTQGVGWTTNVPNKAGDPGAVLLATQLVPATGCGYYVQQGSLYMQKPDPGNQAVSFTSKPVVWNVNPTTGQAFLLQNPSDGLYVTWDSSAIGSSSAIAKAAVFEFVNGYVVVYGTYKSSATASSVTIIQPAASSGTNTYTLASLSTPADICVGQRDIGFTVSTSNVLTYGKSPNQQYLGMPSGTTATFATLTSSTGSLIMVQPPASMIDPSTLYIYAYGAYTNMNFANPTPYTFNPNVCRSSSKKKPPKKKISTAAIAGIAGGAALVVILVVAGVVYWYKSRQTS
jgi:hypothetical protein